MFNMASSTKPILGVAAMIMIEEGKFKPSDPVEKYIPEFKGIKVVDTFDKQKSAWNLVDAHRPVSIHDLLTHTSGITALPQTKGKKKRKRGSNNKSDTDVKKQYAYDTLATYVHEHMAKDPLAFQPGTKWGYGGGLEVVARVIEIVSGMSYNEFVQARIFDPLDMKDTHWIVPKDKLPRMMRFVKGKAGSSTRYFSASAGLVSTARDYLHFEQMLVNKGELFGNRILKPESVEMMSRDQVDGLYSSVSKGGKGMAYGYAVGITVDPEKANNGRSVGAFGWGGAGGTVSWTEPKEMLTGVIMVQQPTRTLSPAIAKVIAGALTDGQNREGQKLMKLTEEEQKKIDQAKQSIPRIPVPPLEGSLVHHKDFPSQLIRPRPVDVWFPEGYDAESGERYPVIYMHDGQMIFHHPDSSLAGMDVFWDVDKVMTRLISNNEIRPAIVVSVWMADWETGARGAEYMPQKALTEEVWQRMREGNPKWTAEAGGHVLSSDNYLKFLVTELKPFIDETYPTLPDSADTFVLGSSMGGLISAYAIAEYPDVFGGAACMSTDWTIGEGVVARWFNDHWPTPGKNRIYFDYGTETFDAHYEPYQMKMDNVMRKYGYTEEEDWVTRRFEGADHSPKSWNARLHVPLTFLLGELLTHKNPIADNCQGDQGSTG